MQSFIKLFVFAAVIGAAAITRSYLRDRRLRRCDWGELVKLLAPLPGDKMESVALDLLRPHITPPHVDLGQMWELIGGRAGLHAMYKNTRILCALSHYAERWNFDKAYVVTERIRMEAWTVRMMVVQVSVRTMTTSVHLNGNVPFLLQQAIASYYLMHTRVLSLYEATHAARLTVIKAQLKPLSV